MILGDILFTFALIQSPFLMLCFYPLLKRFSILSNPYLVIPAFATVSIGLYFWRALNPHYISDGGIMIVIYALMTFQMGYKPYQSLAVSIVTIIALDEIWQIPLIPVFWGSSSNLLAYGGLTSGIFNGLTTAGWSLMCFPILFYFIIKFNGRIHLGSSSKWFLLTSSAFTGWCFQHPDLSYYLILPWLGFFLSVFYNSRPDLQKLLQFMEIPQIDTSR